MIVWLLVSLALWAVLVGGVWALLFGHGEQDARSIDVTVEE